ncbi:MAG: isoleucine--tRNA ligase [Bacteroidia bacterium]
MSKKYPEYKQLELSNIGKEMLEVWKKEDTFKQSVDSRNGKPDFVFYEGPPSANGLPGIHHVMARAIKDIFCRYKTLKGFRVKRKAGWDTHGLPIELSVEKTLGITKEDIGKKISVEDYNKACRKEVMKYTHVWNDLTEKMGYWVDMEHPYITYENDYIESVWYLLSKFYEKGLLYKGYTIQPYSPAAGTGLSTHELNQPGAYRDVKDRTAVVMFKAVHSPQSIVHSKAEGDVYFLAWTTTPWTLPSNTALAVGKNIDYVLVKTLNPFTKKDIRVILAKELLDKVIPLPNVAALVKQIEKEDPFESNALERAKLIVENTRIVEREFKGSELEGIRYEQLLPFAQPADGDAFKVVLGDFVTTSDGTGIVHIAPSFGADDFRVAKQNGIGSLTLVDKRGRFLPEVKDDVFLYGEEYVKEAYLSDEEKKTEFQKQKKILEAAGKIKELKAYLSVDERIVLKLQEEGKLFKKETYEHSYPHCWRTDKPVLYYPLDSWFIKTTAMKDKLIAKNKEINWKPEATGSGRFGNWLENLVDWNLSRSRFWGIPIPIWRTEDGTEEMVVNSVEQLKAEIEKSVKAGFETLTDVHDLHKPYIDKVVLVSDSGKPMFREPDLIDVWFDSGAMPYAQLHYPFENKELIDEKKYFPADFIAEGVDQTRGWFFTLHAIGVMLFDSVAYKTVVSNGLVLDKNGNKMSKRLGNAVDPFETIDKYSADATRWYMITNAQPWDNLKFDTEGIAEVQRKFFGTLHNTYAFFSLYANIDKFTYAEAEIPVEERPELDRWILSLLNSLVKDVDEALADYEPTKAGRAIQDFVTEHLSNWYVRLSRRRFWKGDYTKDKISGYQTIYKCLETIAKLSSPVAPFYADKLFRDLNFATGKDTSVSVHLSDFPVADEKIINKQLEARMELAQRISSLVLSLRKGSKIRVRQPLSRIMVPVLNEEFQKNVEAVKDLILSEVNVKEIEFLTDSSGILVKKIKPNFKSLGPKFGKHMKAIAAEVNKFGQAQIAEIEQTGAYNLEIEGDKIQLSLEDVEISSQDIPGWLVASEGKLTVALDITISEKLREEGIAREFVNRIQNIRKDKDFAVTDRIRLKMKSHESINSAIQSNLNYICTEILAESLDIVDEISATEGVSVDVEDSISTLVSVIKLN